MVASQIITNGVVKNMGDDDHVIDRFQLKDDPNKTEICVRPLDIGDYDKGFAELLHQLADTLPMSRSQFEERFHFVRELHGDVFHMIVAEDMSQHRIVAAGTLVVEHKFIQQCGQKGHIEDVVVDQEFRGQQIGIRMIKLLKQEAVRRGCTPVVLTCQSKNIPFYEKAGFHQQLSNHMRWYPERD